MDVLQLLFQRLAELVVDRRKRLVEEQDVRLVGQRTRQGHPLALAAGALGDILAVVGLGQAQLRHQFERARLARRRIDALHLQRELDVLSDRPMREQRQRLEYHAGRPLVGRQIVDALAAQQDVAAARRLHAGQHAQHRRLATAGRADDGEELTLVEIQVYVVHRSQGAKGLGQAAQLQYRYASHEARIPEMVRLRKSGGRPGAVPDDLRERIAGSDAVSRPMFRASLRS